MPDVQVVLVGTPGPAGSGIGSHEALSNALGHVRVVTSATRPSPTASDEGVVIYEEDTDKFYVWDGSTWQELHYWINRFKGAVAKKSGAQTIANGTFAALAFDEEQFDTDAFHDNSTNNTRLTVPAGLGGYYEVKANCLWAANGTGIRELAIRKNGDFATGGPYPRVDLVPHSASAILLNVSGIFNLSAGDYVEAMVGQTSGGNLDITADNELNWLSAHYLGR